jgi:hypothetical protein
MLVSSNRIGASDYSRQSALDANFALKIFCDNQLSGNLSKTAELKRKKSVSRKKLPHPRGSELYQEVIIVADPGGDASLAFSHGRHASQAEL